MAQNCCSRFGVEVISQYAFKTISCFLGVLCPICIDNDNETETNDIYIILVKSAA